MKILMVEDDPDHELLARTCLERAGDFAVTTVRTYQACRRALKRQRFDVILLDYNLPREDGLVILKRLRRDGALETPIVVVTGFGHEQLAVEALQAGAFDYIVKSQEYPQMLPERIRRVLERYRMIREKERLDEELRLTKTHLENLIESSLDAILSLKNHGKIRFFNQRFLEMTGHAAEAVRAREMIHFFPEEHRALVHQKREEAEAGRASLYETELLKADGSPLPCLISHTPLKSEGGTLMVIKDTSQIVTLQKQLLQSEKLSALGQMISGVAHELNNPLAGILGYSQLLLEQTLTEENCRDVSVIVREAMRCKKIVQNLLTFARQHTFERNTLRMHDVLETVLELRMYQLTVDSVQVVKEFDPALPAVIGDFYQLQQVFLNLINNAHYALRLSERREKRLVVRTARADSQVVIQVSDNGVGMSPEVQTRIFDPFFTTKEVGQGTGLGLSICYGIVQSHRGTLEVVSSPEQGTTFTVKLPIADQPETASTPPADSERPGHRSLTENGRLRCLVIDDEEVIVGLVKRILEREGHEVEGAADGEQALDLIGRRRYDLLVCDVKMPRMSGDAFYRALERRAPHLRDRLIFLTGDVVNWETRQFLNSIPHYALQKPFRAEELLAIVREL